MLKEINIENLEEKLILTSVNQTWFKFLAVITILCSIVVYTALIWLLVCRTNRLRVTDEEIKQNHLLKLQKKTQRNSRFTKNIKYLLFGQTSSPSIIESNYQDMTSNAKPSILVNELNETTSNNKTNKSKYKRKDSKLKTIRDNLKDDAVKQNK